MAKKVVKKKPTIRALRKKYKKMMSPKPKKVDGPKAMARRLQKAINSMRKQLSKMERELRKIK